MSGHKKYKAKQYLHNGKLVNVSGNVEPPNGAVLFDEASLNDFLEQQANAQNDFWAREFGIAELARKKLEAEYDALSDKEKKELLGK